MGESRRVMCASCGTIHYDIICPNCNSVVFIDVKDNRK